MKAAQLLAVFIALHS